MHEPDACSENIKHACMQQNNSKSKANHTVHKIPSGFCVIEATIKSMSIIRNYSLSSSSKHKNNRLIERFDFQVKIDTMSPRQCLIATYYQHGLERGVYSIGTTWCFSVSSKHLMLFCFSCPLFPSALPKVIAEAVLGRGAKRNRNATIHGYVGTNRAYLQCIVAGGQPEPEVQWERLTGQKVRTGIVSI